MQDLILEVHSHFFLRFFFCNYVCLSGKFTAADWDSSEKGIHTGKYVIIRWNWAEGCVASETIVKEIHLCETQESCAYETPGKPSM